MVADRRSELLEQATAWVMEHGLHGLSLRPLAAALGTSARMLVYHFGSKDELTVAILERVASRWMGALQAQRDEDVELGDAIERLWRETLCAPGHRRIQALAFEAWAIGLSSDAPAYRPFVQTVASGWVELLTDWSVQREGLEAQRARVRATLLVAAIEGLLLHHLSDSALPVDEAFAQLLAWWRA